LQDCPSASQVGVFTNDKKQDKVVAAVKRWLEHAKNTRWLLVFDNYDNPKVPGHADPGAVDIRQFLPEAHHGSVIVTTRSSKVRMGRRVKVGKLEDVRDSLQILSDASHREGVMDGELVSNPVLYCAVMQRSRFQIPTLPSLLESWMDCRWPWLRRVPTLTRWRLALPTTFVCTGRHGEGCNKRALR
jgi:hypothetical protein